MAHSNIRGGGKRRLSAGEQEHSVIVDLYGQHHAKGHIERVVLLLTIDEAALALGSSLVERPRLSTSGTAHDVLGHAEKHLTGTAASAAGTRAGPAGVYSAGPKDQGTVELVMAALTESRKGVLRPVRRPDEEVGTYGSFIVGTHHSGSMASDTGDVPAAVCGSYGGG